MNLQSTAHTAADEDAVRAIHQRIHRRRAGSDQPVSYSLGPYLAEAPLSSKSQREE